MGLHITLCAGPQEEVVIIGGAPNVIGGVLFGQVTSGTGHLKVPGLEDAGCDLDLLLADVH